MSPRRGVNAFAECAGLPGYPASGDSDASDGWDEREHGDMSGYDTPAADHRADHTSDDHTSDDHTTIDGGDTMFGDDTSDDDHACGGDTKFCGDRSW